MAYVVGDLLEAPHRVRSSCGEQSEPFAAGLGPERVCFWARLRHRLGVSPHLKQHFLPCQFFLSQLVVRQLEMVEPEALQVLTSLQMEIGKHPYGKVR